MPYCKHCHQEISKFDTDICPHCGGEKPIAIGYQTMDVTRTFKTAQGDYEMPRTRSQKIFSLLCMFLGFFGVHEFYIYRPKRGIFCIVLTILAIVAVGLPLYLTGLLHNALAFVIPLLGVWALFVIMGFLYLKVESPKDGRGEFLR